MPSTKFHIVNLGCKVNRIEADSIHASLAGRGSVHVDEEAADLIIVNTCTVTAEADKKARKAVHHALAVNPFAEVVVTGCAAAVDSETFCAMSPRVRVMGKPEIMAMTQVDESKPALRIGNDFNTRVGIKVQDGCDHACSYCIVRVARGKARSMPATDAIREARPYFEAGVREIVLAGIDIGAYRDGDIMLAQLLHMLLDEADDAAKPGSQAARIRISSIEPLSVDNALIDLLASSDGRVCRHLHIPLQSGSSKVLSEMARPYTALDYANLVSRLRNAIPGIALSTDVIVGFPGETEDDFEDTCRLVRDAGFMRLHVFPYSKRAGTPAALRSDQIPPEVKRERAARLRDIGRQLAHQDLSQRCGTTELCLVEGTKCLTESYHEIPSPKGCESGSLVPVRISASYDAKVQ